MRSSVKIPPADRNELKAASFREMVVA